MARTLLALIVAGLAAVPVYSAGDDATSLSYIAYLERYATVRTAVEEGSLEARINMPVLPGDRIDSAREARLEVALADGSTVWLDEYTSVSFDAIAWSRGSDEGRTVLYLADGIIVVEIPPTALVERPTRVDARTATVYLTPPGLYRLEALPSGGLRVEAWEGLAEVDTPAGGILVRAGSAVEASGPETIRTGSVLTRDDSFARWVAERRAGGGGETALRIDERYAREGEVLDRYGTWVYLEELEAWAWRPDVAEAWSPYWYGRWYWTPAGWTWLSYEPWGWLPYHYGSWYLHPAFGWVWFWDPVWGPAWVDWLWWPGYVGWAPRGYFDLWWWWYGGWGGWWWGPGEGVPRGRTRPVPAGGAKPLPGGATRPVPGDESRPLPAGDTRPLPVGDGRDRERAPRLPARFALDLSGEVDLGRIDAMPWRVVRAEDFASPHLPRLVRPLEEVRATAGRGTATVRSGPLLTEPPARSRPARAVEAAFRGTALRATADLTPVLARTGATDPGQLGDAVRPVTTERLVRGRLEAAPRTVAPRPSPVRPTTPEARTRPNVHRPWREPAPAPRRSVPVTGTSPRAPVRPPTTRGPVTRPPAIPRSGSGTVGRTPVRPSSSRRMAPSPRSGPSRIAPRAPFRSRRPTIRISPRRTTAPRTVRPTTRISPRRTTAPRTTRSSSGHSAPSRSSVRPSRPSVRPGHG